MMKIVFFEFSPDGWVKKFSFFCKSLFLKLFEYLKAQFVLFFILHLIQNRDKLYNTGCFKKKGYDFDYE